MAPYWPVFRNAQRLPIMIVYLKDMRIDPHSKTAGVTEMPKPATVTKPRLEPDKVDLKATEKLNRALEQAADVRTDKVARAKALVAEPGYPSKEVMSQVARVLAKDLRA